jgi:hypothetical protein
LQGFGQEEGIFPIIAPEIDWLGLRLTISLMAYCDADLKETEI